MTELLIKGGCVVTMGPGIGDFASADVHVRDGRLVAVAPQLDVPGAEIIDAVGKIVTPGLVDGHRHVWQSLLRGVSVDWSFSEYMVEARSMYCGCFEPEDAYVANYLGGLEAVAAGITSLVDHSHLQASPAMSDALAAGLLASGVGGIFCYALQNVPVYCDGAPIDKDDVRDMLMRVPDAWHDGNAARVQAAFHSASPLKFGVALPETTPYLPAEMAEAAFRRAAALKPSFITGHWNATMRDGSYVSSLPHLVEAGVFTTPTSLTHCNDLSEADMSLMAANGIGLSTCPDIECGMGIGRLQARRFGELGGASSLGLDLSSYAQSDILKQARLMLQTERKRLADAAGHMPAKTGWAARGALEMVTIKGAQSLGLDHEVGSLTPGKRADVVIVAPNPVLAMPVIDPVATLLFYTDTADVETVIVNGDVRKQGGHLVGVDLKTLQQDCAHAAARVQGRYKLLPRDTLRQVWAGMFG